MKKPAKRQKSKAAHSRLKRLRELRAVRSMYEHNAATGIALLLPFLAIVIAKFLFILSIPTAAELAEFYRAWVFTTPVTFFWALIFPLIALVINFTSLRAIVRNHRFNGPIRPQALLRDILPSLAIVLLSLLALTIVFGYNASKCKLDASSELNAITTSIADCQNI